MKPEWLRFFESQQKNEESEETESLFLKEKIILFLKTFRHQPAQYKIVWTVRILCWILILGVGICGLMARIITYFK